MTEERDGKAPGKVREPEDLTLEARLRRLEEIVRQLEAEELELDRALALFEEGIRHSREAEKALAAAELRVEELLGEEEVGEPVSRPLEEAGEG